MLKILIANRGEIACRLIAACREQGLATVAVYAEPDADAPHVFAADEAHLLPGLTPAETYLDAERLLAVAAAAGADAVHPGYGFLSEDAAFAAKCLAAGLIWVGPPPKAIAALGDKQEARSRVAAAGVPVLAGGPLGPDEAGWPAPEDFPVMVKAATGGGGLGLRRVDEPSALKEAIEEARQQCEAAFAARGEGAAGAEGVRLFWEAYLEGARHVEVQLAADAHGGVTHLFERECSVQRRYQKVIEEAPAPALAPEEREALWELAVRAAAAVGYANVGTAEFLWTPARGPVFLEMNTRLQVEHPVTELVTGIDVVALQLRLAQGEPLATAIGDRSCRGHAIEARVYAEDAETGAPAPGRIDHVRWPHLPWVRVDAGVEAGMTLSPHFDPLLAKIIAWGPDRATAVRRLALALARVELAGTLRTNLALLRAVLDDAAFQAGTLDTGYLSRARPTPLSERAETAAVAAFLGAAAPAQGPQGAGPARPGHWAARRWR